MRTKQTGHSAAPSSSVRTPNGVKSSETAPTPTPTQPQLSEADRQRLQLWLDATERPFSVTTSALSKKRKRDAQALQVQDDLWEERLSVQYEVKPRDKWEALRKYKKFTVGSESIAVGHCILVEHEDCKDAKIDLASQWKAKVLEVRALDTEHVHIRVAWLNRPEDLASGRKAYHGKNELIATNQMDIIDAMSVNGSVQVAHWDDNEDEITPVNEEQFFWRQTYDFTSSKTFSKLRLICIDHKPQNPDEMILQCSRDDCRRWLHVKCIAERAVQRAASKSKSTPPKKARPPKASSKLPAVARATKGKYTAEVFITGSSNAPDTGATETEIVVTDPDGEQYAEELCCLRCGETIND